MFKVACHKARVKQKRIRSTLNKPKSLLVQCTEPHQSTVFLIYHREFTDGFFQGKPNIAEFSRIRTSVDNGRGEKLHEV